MTIKKNIEIIGSAGRIMLTDIFYNKNEKVKPVIIYAHGFNGFKDWGNFDAIAKEFATEGFVFVKFNFSHNGTTVEQPEEFIDLQAFSQNNYTKELNDLNVIINWVAETTEIEQDSSERIIYLLGHSRGGGVVILQAAEDRRIKKVATWACVSDCKTPWGNWSEERMEAWKANEVEYYLNARTGQKMPINYQLYKDYEINNLRLDIHSAIASLNIPVLLCHGINDEAVTIDKARLLHNLQSNSKLFKVKSDHVFGRKHPAENNDLGEPMSEVINMTIEFFKE